MKWQKRFPGPTGISKSKYIHIWILLLFSTALSGQIFAPLQHDTKALYTTWPERGYTSTLVITDTSNVENGVVFNTFKTWHVNQQPPNTPGIIPDDDCEHSFWASTLLCYPAVVPYWLGNKIDKVTGHTFHYFTQGNDTLHFNFDLNPGDSTLIYAGIDEYIMMVYEFSDTATFLNFTDSVARYKLAHFTQAGNILYSPLHDAPVTIGKNLGMVHFFRIDSFPQVLQPIELVGHKGTESGMYAIKPKDIYDFNEGDLFQYKLFQSTYAPGTGYTEYVNIAVQSRLETEISIEYSFQ